MKVLLVHHFSGVGGGTISALDLARMLKLLGHKVFFAVPSPCQMIIDSCEDIGIHLCSVQRPPLFTYHNASSSFVKCAVKYVVSLKSKPFWKSFFMELKPDLVILNSSPMAALSSLLNKMCIPCICFVRETFRLDGNCIANLFLRNMIGRCDVALYLTEYDRRSWNTNNVHQFVIPDVVDDFRFKKHKREEIQTFKEKHGIIDGTKYILFLGGISKTKGSLDLLKSYQLISSKYDNIGLIILGNTFKNQTITAFFNVTHRGDAIYIKKCREILAALKRDNKPLLDVGIVDDTSYWYEVSDVVVFPVNLVHQPRPAYEAGYYGKPIIIPMMDNYMEYVKEGENGFLYNKNDVNDLATKLMLSLENPALVKVGNANRLKCRNTHSFEVGMRALDNCIQTINR